MNNIPPNRADRAQPPVREISEGATRRGRKAAPRVVIRGDLFSDSGYAHATRAIAAEIAKLDYDVVGVALHDHPSRRATPFPYPCVSDSEVEQTISSRKTIVINICVPEDSRRFVGAMNIGYFFWETESFPEHSCWKLKLDLMDRLWSPSSWQAELMARRTRHQAIAIVPWPQEATNHPKAPDLRPLVRVGAHAPISLEQLENYRRRAAGNTSRAWRLKEAVLRRTGIADYRYEPQYAPRASDVIASYGTRFLAIQTDAPRKGLPLLLTAWFNFLERASSPACLIIKTSSLDVGRDFYNQHFHNSIAVQSAASRWNQSSPNIFFIYDRLSAHELSMLTLAADALVSATMGEGFGGPIADALLRNRNVIAPRHTAIADLLPADYPFAVNYETAPLKLWNNIPIYSPSSTWRVVDDDDMAVKLAKLQAMTPARRRTVAAQARRHVLATMGQPVVREIIATELANLKAAVRT